MRANVPKPRKLGTYSETKNRSAAKTWAAKQEAIKARSNGKGPTPSPELAEVRVDKGLDSLLDKVLGEAAGNMTQIESRKVGLGSPAGYFPGYKGNQVNLMASIESQFEAYSKAGFDLDGDVRRLLAMTRTGDITRLKGFGFGPGVRQVLTGDPANMTAAAYLLLLSWVQRTRVNLLKILMEPKSETVTSKSAALRRELLMFLVGPE